LVKVVQDIWILTENGITVFSRVYNPTVSDQLFGALMSALNQFAEEISDGGISNFSLSDNHFYILKKNKFIFIASSPTKKEKKIRQELQVIADKFFKKHTDLDDWDYDISIFKDFQEEIEDSLKETIEKFKQAFW
jgi:hypothetical protein